jgi:hypothetical protein
MFLHIGVVHLVPVDLLRGGTPEQAVALARVLIAGYGGLLVAWPAIVASAVNLRDRGFEWRERSPAPSAAACVA